MFTREAIEKLAQFQNATENEKNGEKIENTAAKEQEIFTFSDGKNGYEILEGMHHGTSPVKQRRKNN